MNIRLKIRVAGVCLLLALLLAACGFIEDLLPLPTPPEPVDPLPVGSCAELELKPVTPFTTALGSWDLGFGAASMQASSVLLPVPVGAPGNAATFDHGPDTWGNRYPPVRNYFGIDCEGVPGVVWQSGNTGEVLLTLFEADLAAANTWSLPSAGQRLLAATFGNGRIYYVTTLWGATGEPGEDLTAEVRLHAYTLSEPADSAYTSVPLDASRDGFNMIAPTRAWDGHAALAFNDGKLALIISRLMHEGSDGLNHQGATAAVFSSETLALLSYLGQTSGHSFGTYLAPASGGRFVAIDHGDNYPRAVHLHMLDTGNKQSRAVFTFKTLHGTTPSSPAGVTYPVYEEISGETTYYQWSNDNNVYGEIGTVLEYDDGYLVTFIGEPDANGRALRNDRATNYVGDARNVGMVKVVRDFSSVSSGTRNVVPDQLVMSGGAGSVTETGGFYNFGGGWDEQRNAGLRWITDNTDQSAENASRLTAVKVGEDAALLLWETWTATEYVETNFAVIDTLGGVLVPPTSLGSSGSVRLSRSDDPLTIGDNVFLFDGRGLNLYLTVLQVNGR